jgi:phospholipase/lecithinase/hemolysin
MTSLQSLIDGYKAATTPISLATLEAQVAPQFIGPGAVTAPAAGFSGIYAFGDSLSDVGNASIATLHAVPAGPYSDGRFSNGDIWLQDLARNLGLPAVQPSFAGGTDFAVGGALTGPSLVHAQNPSDLPSQYGEFVAFNPHPSPNALYTVWAGSNDVLDIANDASLTPVQQQQAVQQAVNNEVGIVDGLIAHGARNLVVLNVPDLSQIPYETVRPASDAAAGALAQQYNADLAASLHQVMASGVASIDLIDTYSLLDSAIANPAAYGFTNVRQPVWTGNLTDPHSGVLNATGAAQGGFLFFDEMHPTATGHAYVASAVAQTLTHPV